MAKWAEVLGNNSKTKIMKNIFSNRKCISWEYVLKMQEQY
jgi:hypothetical protein